MVATSIALGIDKGRLRHLVTVLWKRAAAANRYAADDWCYFIALGPLGDADLVIDDALRRRVAAMTSEQRREHLSRALHVLWTIAAGAPGYDKAEWRELEGLVGIGYPDPDVLEAARRLAMGPWPT